MKILLSPHSDDAVLFATHIILRENPLVVTVTHSTLQGNNGLLRVVEDYQAMHVLDAPITFLGIYEDELTEAVLLEKLRIFPLDAFYYIPEYEKDGNPHHNIVNNTVRLMTSNYKEYKTYSGLEDRTVGKEVVLTRKELEQKRKAEWHYRSQIENANTSHYFFVDKEYE